jgi:hypothetical protein
MEHPVTRVEAQAALDTAKRGRLRVIDEIGLPTWYWLFLALGWIALGLLSDLEHGWIAAVATFIFGAANAAAMSRVASGRHRSSNLSVRRSVAGPNPAWILTGALLALGALTVGLALLANADGAGHPVTTASIVVATIIILGGPRLFDTVKRNAARAPVA